MLSSITQTTIYSLAPFYSQSTAMSGSITPSSSTAPVTSTSSPLSKNDNTSSPSSSTKADAGSKEGVTEGTASNGAPEAKVGEAAVQVEETTEEEADVGEPSTEEVVDMEVFGQLLEIVRYYPLSTHKISGLILFFSLLLSLNSSFTFHQTFFHLATSVKPPNCHRTLF